MNNECAPIEQLTKEQRQVFNRIYELIFEWHECGQGIRAIAISEQLERTILSLMVQGENQ